MRFSLAIAGAAVLSIISLPSRAYVKTYTATSVSGHLNTALYIESNRCPKYTLNFSWFKEIYPLPGSFCVPMPTISTDDFSYKEGSSCSSGYKDIGYGLCLRISSIQRFDKFRESIKGTDPFGDIFAGARKNLETRPPTYSQGATFSQPKVVARSSWHNEFERNAKRLVKDNDINSLYRLSNDALSKDDKYGKAWFYRGYAKDEMGDYRGALTDLDKSIALNPDLMGAYLNRGFVKSKLGDKQGAIADYTVATRADKVDTKASAYNNRASAKWDVGDKKGFCIDFEKSASLSERYAKNFDAWIKRPKSEWCRKILAVK